jgi:hypothetical protein
LRRPWCVWHRWGLDARRGGDEVGSAPLAYVLPPRNYGLSSSLSADVPSGLQMTVEFMREGWRIVLTSLLWCRHFILTSKNNFTTT